MEIIDSIENFKQNMNYITLLHYNRNHTNIKIRN